MMIERRKMTRATYQALKRYILLEREKKKQGDDFRPVCDIIYDEKLREVMCHLETFSH